MLERGTLWRRVDEVAAAALAAGALEPIATAVEVIPDDGVRFVVRVLERLARKIEHTLEQRRTHTDPFLPPEPELLVGGISPTHLAVLNKFNVLDRHLLIVTRAFRSQEEPLDRDDLAALAWCLAEGDALGFYNGGAVAGASQPHKHLQLVPLPLAADDGGPTPIDVVLGSPAPDGSCPGLHFRHAVTPLRPADAADPERLLAESRRLLAAAGVAPGAPYNLLVTRRWMLAVPRPVERWHGVSVNALGFAGSLLVPDRPRLERVRAAGPMAVLAAVTGNRAGGKSVGSDRTPRGPAAYRPR